MSKARFDKAFGQFLQRGEEKIAPKTFFETLAEIERERALKTVALRARIVEGQLRFEPSEEVTAQGNEIVLGNRRIVVEMA